MMDATRLDAVASAYRERRGDGTIAWSPEWWDLDEAGRAAAFEHTVQTRRLEAALDPDGLSPTGRAVLGRILGR